MTTIDLIRHGETASNASGRFRGTLDLPLTERGLEQADALARLLKRQRYSAYYSSPLTRARQTLQPLCDTHRTQMTVDPRLDNLQLPLWEGKSYEEVKRRWPEAYQQWLTAPETMNLGGHENLTDVGNRALALLDEIVSRYEGQQIVLCSHRSVLKPLLSLALGIQGQWFWRLNLDTGSVTRLVHSPHRGYQLDFLNLHPQGNL